MAYINHKDEITLQIPHMSQDILRRFKILCLERGKKVIYRAIIELIKKEVEENEKTSI
jgi:hypothetical protein